MGCSVRFASNLTGPEERRIEGLTCQRCAARGESQRKVRRVESATSKSAVSGVSLYPPHSLLHICPRAANFDQRAL
jgi:hypothetical protein